MLNIYFQNEMIKILYGDKKGDYYGKKITKRFLLGWFCIIIPN